MTLNMTILAVTASLASAGASACDWQDKRAFETCVHENFAPGHKLAALEAFLQEHGFTRAPDTAEQLAYFYRDANNGSGYGVVVWSYYSLVSGNILKMGVN